jgi:hypothetical protein
MNAQHTDVWIVRSSPPHFVGGLPDFGRLGGVAPHVGARRDREVGIGLGVNENEPDIVLGFDFVLLAAAQIGHDPDDARRAIGPCFKRPGS